jgi:hypothetical protein
MVTSTFLKNEGADPSAPSLSGTAAAFEINNDPRVFVFGGQTEDLVTNEAWFFYPPTGKWTSITPSTSTKPPARSNHLIGAVFGSSNSTTFFVLGGIAQDGSPLDNKVWLYDTGTNHWESFLANSIIPLLYQSNAYVLIPEPKNGNVFILYKNDNSDLRIWPFNLAIREQFSDFSLIAAAHEGPFIATVAQDTYVNYLGDEEGGVPLYILYQNDMREIQEYKIKARYGKIGFGGAHTAETATFGTTGGKESGYTTINIDTDSDSPTNFKEFLSFSYFPSPTQTGRTPLVLSTRPSTRILDNASFFTERLVLYGMLSDLPNGVTGEPQNPSTSTWFLTDFDTSLGLKPRWERTGSTGDPAPGQSFTAPMIAAGKPAVAMTTSGFQSGTPGGAGLIVVGGQLPNSTDHYQTPYSFSIYTNESSSVQWSKLKYETDVTTSHAATLRNREIAILAAKEFKDTGSVDSVLISERKTADHGIKIVSNPPIGPGIIAGVKYIITVELDPSLNQLLYDYDIRIFRPPGVVPLQQENNEFEPLLVAGGSIHIEQDTFQIKPATAALKPNSSRQPILFFTAPEDGLGSSYFFRAISHKKGTDEKDTFTFRSEGVKLKRTESSLVAVSIVIVILIIISVLTIGGGLAYYFRRKHHRHSLPFKKNLRFHYPNTFSSR